MTATQTETFVITQPSDTLTVEERIGLYLAGSKFETLGADKKTGLKPTNQGPIMDDVGEGETKLYTVRFNKGAMLDLVQQKLDPIRGTAQVTGVAVTGREYVSVEDVRALAQTLPKKTADVLLDLIKRAGGYTYPRITLK